MADGSEPGVPVTILAIGAEGGSLTIFGERSTSGAWSFFLHVDETATCDLLDEEDQQWLEPRSTSPRVHSFDAAIALLDKYPWFRLCLMEVHPEFAAAVRHEVRKRASLSELAQWQEELLRQSFSMFSGRLNQAADGYAVGALVQMSSRQDWGPGKIVDIVDNKLHIIFRDRRDGEGGRPTILLRTAPALHLAGVQSDPLLDNLPPLVGRPGSLQLPKARLTFKEAWEKFLHHFPGGFENAHYLKEERAYKVAANRRFQEEIGLKRAREAFAAQDAAQTDAVISLAASITTSVRLVAPFESAAFHDALRDKAAARIFYEAFFNLLNSPEFGGREFDAYVGALEQLPAKRGRVATWPNATVPLYIAQPERFLFLKPEVSKAAAEMLAFDLRYESRVNWATYSAFLEMGNVYLNLLRPLGARDLIDVQTFIFVVGGGYD